MNNKSNIPLQLKLIAVSVWVAEMSKLIYCKSVQQYLTPSA